MFTFVWNCHTESCELCFGGNILTVCGKRFRCAEVLLQPGFTGTRVSGFYDTFLQSSMKCDFYIRKELYAISRCQVARSCSKSIHWPCRSHCRAPELSKRRGYSSENLVRSPSAEMRVITVLAMDAFVKIEVKAAEGHLSSTWCC